MMTRILLFLSLLWTANFINAGENNIMIQEVIQEENKNFFSPRSLKIDFLKNHPDAIPTLADWLYDEWHSYDAALTKEKLISNMLTRLNDDRIPITFVVLRADSDKVVGTVALKKQTTPELNDFPEDSLWLGSLQVDSQEQNQGIGSELVKFVQKVAKGFGYKDIYFYTSNPSNVPWYLKRGACFIEERPFRGHRINLMYFKL